MNQRMHANRVTTAQSHFRHWIAGYTQRPDEGEILPWPPGINDPNPPLSPPNGFITGRQAIENMLFVPNLLESSYRTNLLLVVDTSSATCDVFAAIRDVMSRLLERVPETRYRIIAYSDQARMVRRAREMQLGGQANVARAVEQVDFILNASASGDGEEPVRWGVIFLCNGTDYNYAGRVNPAHRLTSPRLSVRFTAVCLAPDCDVGTIEDIRNRFDTSDRMRPYLLSMPRPTIFSAYGLCGIGSLYIEIMKTAIHMVMDFDSELRPPRARRAVVSGEGGEEAG